MLELARRAFVVLFSESTSLDKAASVPFTGHYEEKRCPAKYISVFSCGAGWALPLPKETCGRREVPWENSPRALVLSPSQVLWYQGRRKLLLLILCFPLPSKEKILARTYRNSPAKYRDNHISSQKSSLPLGRLERSPAWKTLHGSPLPSLLGFRKVEDVHRSWRCLFYNFIIHLLEVED